MSTNESARTDELLKQAGQGDSAAVEQLMAAHRRYLRAVIELRMDHELRLRVDPSDVVQETQLIASQRLDDFLRRRPTSFRIWLRRKALERLVDLRRHHVIAEMRSVRREVTLSDHSSMTMASSIQSLLRQSPDHALMARELAQQVREAISNMKDMDREVLLLRHVEGLTNAEVAEVMEIETVAASQRYGRALRRLREQLLDRGITDEDQ